MEALAAVGLAGNVVQFIDFGCSLFIHANSIYHSQSGATKGAQDLETITKSLLDLSAQLERSLDKQPQHGYRYLQAQQNLRFLAKGCHNIAKELVTILQNVRAKSPGSKWHSFRASLAGLLKEAEISELEKRLNNYRSQIIIELQALQRIDQGAVLSRLSGLEKQGQQMGVSVSDQISALRREMRDSLAALPVIQLKLQDAQQAKASHQDSRLDIKALANSLTHLGDSGAALTGTLYILHELRFEGMSQRYTNIRKAHTGTFEWAFANQLSKWLQSDDAIFWVTGKPGSGKSTLMKRLVDDPRTSLLLRHWSGAEDPVIASYFYWIKGTGLQRSDVGLLRCVLYDYLRQCPSATPYVFGAFWESVMALVSRPNSMEWKREDLIQAFHRLADLDTESAHLCLFIDGLDEYQGDHQDVIETIQYLSRLKIKLCVASRPWNVFEETFGHLPRLRMQDLNRSDIEIYVKDHLFLRHDFQRARSASNDMAVIMAEITEKSQGVFLWVYLVVRSLIEGLRNSDPMSLLMKRLSSFPSDLNDFFYDIFVSLDPIYRDKTAKMFLLTLETMSPLYMDMFEPMNLVTLTHWYLDELEEQPDLPLSLQATDVDEDTIIEYSSVASLRINGRCKGLLEMVPGAFQKQALQQGQPAPFYWYGVTFLHRTVADFFETPKVRNMLNEWLEEDLNTWYLICRATLAEIKCLLGLNSHVPFKNLVQSAVTRFLSAASLHEKSCGETLMPLLNELARVLIHHQLCTPLVFARLTVEYDLLIFVESSPLTKQWTGHPASKLSVLEGIGEAGLGFWVGNSKRDLTSKMICLIHSMGSTVEIGQHAQDVITRDKSPSDEEYVARIRQLTRTAYFELDVGPTSNRNTIRKEFASTSFHQRLINIIGPEQTRELVDVCQQSLEKSQKEKCQNDQRRDKNTNQEKDQGKGKKNLFRKLFGRTKT